VSDNVEKRFETDIYIYISEDTVYSFTNFSCTSYFMFGERIEFTMSVPSLNRFQYRRFLITPNARAYEIWKYEGWNFNSGNYLFTTDTK